MRNETNEQLHVSVRKLFSERLKVEPNIVSIHRLRPRENPEKVPERPRAVLVKLSSFEEKMECVRAAPRLKGTNVYINEDVSRATLNIIREKLDELREKRRKGYIAYFSGAKLVVKERKNNNLDARSTTSESVGSRKSDNSKEDPPQRRTQRKTNNKNGVSSIQKKQLHK